MVFGADSEYYTDEAYQIVDSSKEIAESLRQDYAELEKQILALDPDYAKYLQHYVPDGSKLAMTRSYLAQKAFDYYKDTFMSELEQHSKETGRKISTKSFGPNQDNYNFTEKFWWLDRGKLDTAECHKDGNINDFPICKYPDGFEEYLIDVEEYNQKDEYGVKALFGNNFYTKILTYDKDIRDKNAHQYCYIGLQYESVNHSDATDSVFFDQVSLDLACDVTKYDEYYAWQNQEVEDTINGKWDVIGTEELPDGRVRQIFRDEENWQKWKSNHIPTAVVFGVDNDYSQSITTTYKDAE